MKVTLLKGPTVRLQVDADEWQLYNGETLEQDQERDVAAEDLNRGMEELIAACPDRVNFKWKELDQLLKSKSSWGASDSEGYRTAWSIIDKAYPAG